MGKFLSGVGKSLNSVYKLVGSRLPLDELRASDGVTVVHDMAQLVAAERATGAGGIGPQAAVAQSTAQVLSLSLCQATANGLRYTASMARLTMFSIAVETPANWVRVVAMPFMEDLGGGSPIYGPPIFAWNSGAGGSVAYPSGAGPFATAFVLLNELPHDPLPQMFYGYQQPDAPGLGNSRFTGVAIQASTAAFGAGTDSIAALFKIDLVAPGSNRANGFGLQIP